MKTPERQKDGTALPRREFSHDLHQATKQISSLGKQRKWQEALAVFAAVEEPDAVIRAAMIDACTKSSQLEAAQQLFAEMPERNLGAYTSLINIFGRLRRVSEAEELLGAMRQDSIEPDGFVYASLVMAYGAVGDVESALRMFRQRQAWGPASKVAFGSVMAACGRNGQLEQTRELLAELESSCLQPDVEHFTSILMACQRRQDEATARQVFVDIRARGMKPDIVAYTMLMACLSGPDAVNDGEALLKQMEGEDGLTPDSFVFDALLQGAINASDEDRFRALLAEMDGRGLSSTHGTRKKVQIMNDRKARAEFQQVRSHTALETLPPGWHATLDPGGSGSHYFWNEKDPTGSTTWERPRP